MGMTSLHSFPRAPRMAMTVLTAQPTSPVNPAEIGTDAPAPLWQMLMCTSKSVLQPGGVWAYRDALG